MSHPLLAAEAGVRHLLLGNEAIVRGRWKQDQCGNLLSGHLHPRSRTRSTISLRAAGTAWSIPSTRKWLEVGGAGAALAGAMSMTTMKHVGVNAVAADPCSPQRMWASRRFRAGERADDPFAIPARMNRTTVRTPGLWDACFEPATAQEAKDMTREALLRLARELQQPVICT